MRASCRLVEISRRFFQVLGRFWASFGDPCWSQFGSQDGLKSEKCRFFLQFSRACKRHAVFETILGRFLQRAESQKWAKVWECLLGITFQYSQHKIDFGRVLGSILGGFGLHFGRFFGAKSEKVALQSELKSKPKKKTIKSHATYLR